MSQYTVLCVDNEDAVGELSTAIESNDSLRSVVRHSVNDAVEAVSSHSIDCLVTEYELNDEIGSTILEKIRQVDPDIPCVLCTSVSPRDIETSAFDSAGIEYYNRQGPDGLDNLGFIVEDIIIHNAQAGFLLPDDEQSRLAILDEYDIETLPIKESFDRLTGLIASHFDVSVAFIGVIDRSTEEFIACTGADWDMMPRDETVCTHSMLQKEVLVVEDVSKDARFKNNELLQELNIVSYAGANLTTPGGSTIGQVCVTDNKPRSYTDDEQNSLQAFADVAMEILDLRYQLDSSSLEGGGK